MSMLDDDEQRLIGPYLTVTRPSGDEWRGFCVECEEPGKSKSPSASYNFNRGEWNCLKNPHGGSIPRLISRLLKAEKESKATNNVVSLDARRKAPATPLPSEEQMSGFEAQLHGSPRLVELLSERKGLSLETMEQFGLGYDSSRKRYVFPIRDRSGALVNVRLYDPLAKGSSPKMLPFAVGYGTQLFHPEVLNEHEEVVLCEGETDCMNSTQHGIPTLTHTGGAGSFQQAWISEFKGKHIFICFDDDDAGRKGALRTARMLRPVAAGVYVVTGIGTTGKPKGDISDFYQAGGTSEQFRSLMEEARTRPFAQQEDGHLPAATGRKVSLEETQNPELQEPLEVSALVAGKQTPPYLGPRKVKAICDQNKGRVCALCPMAAYDGERVIDTKPDDSRLLQFVEANELNAKRVMQEMFGAMCSDRIEFDTQSHWSMEELVVVQSLEGRTEETQNPMSRKVFNVGTFRTPINQSARLVGTQVPDPRNSRGIFHSWTLEPVQSDIDAFQLEEKDLHSLAVFQNRRNQTPLDKAKEVARDLSANVTQIYGREMLHVAYDLVWHSVLSFNFQGKRIEKGWLECLVMGDTRTGKSETADRLTHFYQSGVLKSCEGATFAGLVGGAQASPQGRGWMVTWGTIPLNDRRLVVLDELSGLSSSRGESKGIIEQMSSVRSSGKAQLTKIVSEETSARTRLIWISNPVDGKRLSETPGGAMEAIKKLIPNPEDIARFDFALAASNTDVSPDLINSTEHAAVPHEHKQDAAARLVLWAWSRKADDVRWHRSSDEHVVAAASEMGTKYLSDPPLVQIENIRMKLARIAVAFAARTFSTDRTGRMVIVRPEHVVSAVEFLDWIYSSESMGYLRLSRRIAADREAAARNKPKLLDYLKKNPAMHDALRNVMYAESFRPRDFDEYGGVEMDGRAAVAMLAGWRMIRRLPTQGGRIVLEPALMEVLKELEDQGL